MAALLSCDGDVSITAKGVAKCNSWVLVDSTEFARKQDTEVDPVQLVEAFGAGILVLVIPYAALWKIRALKAAVHSST